MANDLTSDPLYLDTADETSYYEPKSGGSIGSIIVCGHTANNTVLVYNCKDMVGSDYRGFETWSNGTSAAPDGWTLSGASATVAREGTIIKSGSYSVKLTRAGTDCYVKRNIIGQAPPPYNSISYWQGKAIIVGMWVYATVADRAYIEMYDGQATATSSAHGGGSAWTWLTKSATVNAAATELTIQLACKTGNTSVYGDNALLFETKPLVSYKTLANAGDQLVFPRPLQYDGIYLSTLTGGAIQVQS